MPTSVFFPLSKTNLDLAKVPPHPAPASGFLFYYAKFQIYKIKFSEV
jgi:hypothetical protein